MIKLPSPTYVRAIEISNMSAQAVRVTVQYLSSTSLIYDIPANQLQKMRI